eukprot:gnl/TRDRNA2_/TRDRNA2_188903_c0_seq1.p1 gnl/TRDRNA2_/TRDRNA2_188903_c0~~gnl/TRDRNA2_/TRDRNA2_188903_c0_seq1.p1  ORF type:complete len:237 (+),score=20.15 gnl/TRDRNA2_/TRDRNA2_188903_c0_seq1:80-712(+)
MTAGHPFDGNLRHTMRSSDPPCEKFPECYHTQTALGNAWVDTTGFLRPRDDPHKLFRTYGEWFERGVKSPRSGPTLAIKSSRFWPFGQNATKIVQSADPSTKFCLDVRVVDNAMPYIPGKSSSLPDLRTARNSARLEMIDDSYHRNFHKRTSGGNLATASDLGPRRNLAAERNATFKGLYGGPPVSSRQASARSSSIPARPAASSAREPP